MCVDTSETGGWTKEQWLNSEPYEKPADPNYPAEVNYLKVWAILKDGFRLPLKPKIKIKNQLEKMQNVIRLEILNYSRDKQGEREFHCTITL